MDRVLIKPQQKVPKILLTPVCLFNDPFRGGCNKIALCETYSVKGTPTVTNFRHFAKKIFDQDKGENDPWFGVEQEYSIFQPIGTGLRWPLGWVPGSYPKPQGPYYCSVGSTYNYGREIMDMHMKVCLAAGVQIFGTNSEVMPGQWEFQVGTSRGIDIGDHLWMARYLIYRTAEQFGVDISLDPKPVFGDWNGSGAHTNYSTNGTRGNDGMKVVENHMELLKGSHKRLISLYGENNLSRLTGKHETSSIEVFSFGVANRGSSCRIPRDTALKGKGYYEDRRPAANMDPYVVSAALFSTTCLKSFGLEQLENHYNAFVEHKKNISNH